MRGGAWSAVFLLVGGGCAAADVKEPALEPLRDDLRCSADERSVSPFDEPMSEVDAQPTGMNEQPNATFTAAREAFERGAWSVAIPLLRAGIAEQPPEDFNRQLGEFQLAISLYNEAGKRDAEDARFAGYREAETLFVEIASRRGHAKRDDAYVWLLRLVHLRDRDLPAIIDAMRPVCGQTIHECWFGGRPEPEWFDLRHYLCSRAYFRSGEIEDALAAFRSIRPESRYAPFARECISLLPGLPSP